MSRKRKRLKKLIMALRIPRDDTDFYINLGLIMDLNYAEQISAVKEVIKKKDRAADAAPIYAAPGGRGVSRPRAAVQLRHAAPEERETRSGL